ncbi:hypothetical protein ABES03_16525 [Neobacillus rhizosphaerae]|uniref:hypothetical protein n=1 Tax=Neobacillus rhizosphaerae TaxID=2880965 RepID=UPI003D2730DA
MSKGQYVWYASYGSNINNERFLCYIKGGKPVGSDKVETGCRDTSLPLNESLFEIPHPLYFAKESARWGHQGVAFIGLQTEKENVTLSKKYLITRDQFLDILKQENNGLEFDIDLNEVIEEGSMVFRNKAWYGNILYLGESEGYPVFTFTAPWDITEVKLTKPSIQYLSTIITGLKNYFTNDEIYRYLKDKPGISTLYSEEELLNVINN